MEIVKVNSKNFESEVINSKIPVLVDFNATWCGPCKMLGPVLEEISSENDNFKIVSIDVDEEEDLAREYSVFSIPCLVLIKDGKEANRTVGFMAKEDILTFRGE